MYTKEYQMHYSDDTTRRLIEEEPDDRWDDEQDSSLLEDLFIEAGSAAISAAGEVISRKFRSQRLDGHPRKTRN